MGTWVGLIPPTLYTVAVSDDWGQPIAVLEAMSYGCPIIVSDIPAHREIATSCSEFVAVGDIAALTARLKTAFCAETTRQLDAVETERLLKNHDWRQIARQTLDAYIAARPKGRQAAQDAPLRV